MTPCERRAAMFFTAKSALAATRSSTTSGATSTTPMHGQLDESTFDAGDTVSEREKSEVNFLVSGGTAGLRSFSLAPTP